MVFFSEASGRPPIKCEIRDLYQSKDTDDDSSTILVNLYDTDKQQMVTGLLHLHSEEEEQKTPECRTLSVCPELLYAVLQGQTVGVYFGSPN